MLRQRNSGYQVKYRIHGDIAFCRLISLYINLGQVKSAIKKCNIGKNGQYGDQTLNVVCIMLQEDILGTVIRILGIGLIVVNKLSAVINILTMDS